MRNNIRNEIKTPKCEFCGKDYILNKKNNDSDLPIMIGFETEDKKVINVCRYCIISLGENKK